MRALTIHEDTGKFRIYLFNVGQGDHLLIRLPSGAYGIIDFYYSRTEGFTCPPSLTYFRALQAEMGKAKFKTNIKIAFVCFSHYDMDHIKGLSESFSWLSKNVGEIGAFWLPGSRSEEFMVSLLDEKLNDLKEKLKKIDPEILKQITVNRAHYKKELKLFNTEFHKWKTNNPKATEVLRGLKLLDPFAADPDITSFCLGPLEDHLEDFETLNSLKVASRLLNITDDRFNQLAKTMASDQDSNIVSHIIWIKHLGKNLFFGGDCHLTVWEDCLDKFDQSKYKKDTIMGPVRSDFIKASHHGSKTCTDNELWNRIADEKKTIVAVSAGQHNGYKHPSDQWLKDVKNSTKYDIYSTNSCANCILKLPFDNGSQTKNQSCSEPFHWLEAWNEFELTFVEYEEEKKARVEESLDGLFVHGFKASSTLTDPNSELDQEQRIKEEMERIYSNIEDRNTEEGKTDENNLLAFVFEVNENEITVSKAGSALAINYSNCFFAKREPLYDNECQ